MRARHVRLQSRRSPNGRELWLNWVVRERATRRCLGRVEATVIEPEHALIAYLLTPAAQGHGFATEACRAMLAWLRTRCRLQCIEAHIDARNARSITLVQRLGFRRDREAPNANFFKGATSDEVVYVLDGADAEV